MSEIMIAVSNTCDLCMPSARIRAFIAESTRSDELADRDGNPVEGRGAVPAAHAAETMRETTSIGERRGCARRD
jgi:hypothetical protein